MSGVNRADVYDRRDYLVTRAAQLEAQNGPAQPQPSASAPAQTGSSVNNPAVVGGWKQPRLRVLADGKPIRGCVDASVSSNGHYQADRFQATFALTYDPAFGAKFWGEQDTLLLDIQGSLDNGQTWTSLIIGEVSQVDVRWEQYDVQVDGRDLTSRLIEAKTQETFQNRTSSEIATELAGRHGLTADVVATTTPVGRFYQADHAQVTTGEFSRTTTEWDLLTFLAQREGYDVWVSGTVLHFKPQPKEDATPWIVRVQPATADAPVARANVWGLQLSRNLTLARDIVVEVKSWSSRSGRGFTKIARAPGGRGKNKSGAKEAPQKIVLVRPNLTEDEAQKLANKALLDESRHERVVRWGEPADMRLTPRMRARLDGTGTSWDQAYQVASVTRRISFESGFTMQCEAKNRSPESQVALR